MADLVLIGTAKARPFRNVWMLEELQVPYTLRPEIPRSPEVLAMNRSGKVPILKTSASHCLKHPETMLPESTAALQHGNFIMTESAAINTYLADAFRGHVPELVPPAGSQLRGRYEELVSCIITELDAQGLWIHRKHEAMKQFFGHIPEDGERPGDSRVVDALDAAVQHAQQHFCNTVNILLAQLREVGDYLLGNFSAADILLVHCLDWAGVIKWLPSTSIESELQPVLEQYLERCHKRDAYQRAVAQRKAKL
ncbi:Glutathione S-transferase 3 [Durusdinium trenchii]|uniref:Glutathione S-transferase 3 n=1 Tax=Durusdinium trenchii TaxID=1381693 RepID=A0ABP0KAN3_9DINO